MLGLFKKKPEAIIKKEREERLNELIIQSSKLRKLIKYERAGWRIFTELLDDYMDKCKKRKAITALDRATDEEIYQLKLIDHEIFILNFVKRMPEQFIKNVENAIKAKKEEEENEAET